MVYIGCMTTPNSPTGAGHANLLNKAIKLVLTPLVRLMIRRQIPLANFVELVKGVYVEVAMSEEFAIKGKPPTDSRINLITGVHRKDVKRLREAISENFMPERLSINHLILAKWMGDSLYVQAGKPKPLAVSGEESFESLADSVTRKNIRASSILENWLSLGWLVQDDMGLLHLQTEHIESRQLGEDTLYFFAHNVSDHIATAAHNLDSDNKQLERAVFYNQLTQQSLDELEQLSRLRMLDLLNEINAKALEFQDRDAIADDAHHRFRFGGFFYRSDHIENSEKP